MPETTAPPFASVLIANRGEIACRIIKTAQALGMRTIAVYSEADARARHVALADEAVAIGPAPARDSYLVVERLIGAALATKAAAIHPGYGFLSERAEFAEACAAAGIAFVGPPPAAIRAMGLKGDAKALMQRARVPVVPGYHGERQDADFLREKAYEVGYPVLIKAVAGGGGKGMRRVDRVLDFDAALESAQREAQNAFGDPRVLIEKYVTRPRHIEVQVFADMSGHVVSLFERDCSLQRRHQKVIEEAPAPGLSPEMRASLGDAAVAAAKAVGYVGAGTVEFIADTAKGLRPDAFYFMEMNTRLQVEHPVTEAILGLDLVALQFMVAAGQPLPFGRDDVRIDGHAVEARLYAEDVPAGFLPSTGRLWHLAFPSALEGQPAYRGLRIDTGVRTGDVVSPHYDPMIAKVIAHHRTREEALDLLTAALKAIEVAGVKTNAAFLAALTAHPEFRSGQFDTGFIEANLTDLMARAARGDVATDALVAAGTRWLIEEVQARADGLAAARASAPVGWSSPWDEGDAYQLTGERRTGYRLIVDGERLQVEVIGRADGLWIAVEGVEAKEEEVGITVVPADGGVYALEGGRQVFCRFERGEDLIDAGEHGGDGSITAPMHGRVILVLASVDEPVVRGQKLAVVEAMKMEHPILAPMDGIVTAVLAEPGAQVSQGARLFVVEPADA